MPWWGWLITAGVGAYLIFWFLFIVLAGIVIHKS